MKTRGNRLAAGLVLAAMSAAAVMLSAVPANARTGGTTSAHCSGSQCSVKISYSGTAVSHTSNGGTPGVEPDCWFEPWAKPAPAYAVRIIVEVFSNLFPGLLELPLGDLKEFEDAATKPKYKDYEWYLLKCKDGINTLTSEQAMSAAGTTDWFGKQVARMTALVGPDGTPPTGGVAVKTLLDAAQDAMTIPDPKVVRNPQLPGSGATLVNLDTLFWSQTLQKQYSITASAGPVSVTIVAKQNGYVLTSPAGGASCTFEQFTTAWHPGLADDAGCRIPFTKASTGAGWPVDVTATYDATWTATGHPDPQPLGAISSQSTLNVPVKEAQTLVTATN